MSTNAAAEEDLSLFTGVAVDADPHLVVVSASTTIGQRVGGLDLRAVSLPRGFPVPYFEVRHLDSERAAEGSRYRLVHLCASGTRSSREDPP